MRLGAWTLPEPWAWQRDEDRLHGDEPKRGILASPRLGKTLAVALTLRRRAERALWTRCLVVAPLKVCPTWVETLAGAGIPVHDGYSIKSAGAAIRAFAPGQWEGVLVINRDKLLALLPYLDFLDAFVADESHNYAAVSSGRAKAYRKFAWTTPWVRALTGTPVPRHYGSLWSQFAAFGGGWERFSSYEKFAQHFLVRDAMFRSRVLAHINTDELQAMLLGVASFYRREDVFGSDRYQIVQRVVDMPERAWQIYQQLAREWILKVPEGEITAANAGVRLMRLQQITSGFIGANADTGESAKQIHSAKIDAVCEDLDEIVESGEKAVVFHRFVPEGQAVFEAIAMRYATVPVLKLDGRAEVSADENERTIKAFNDVPGAAVIVVQIQSGSEGISLREAGHLMYLSRTFSFTDDEQSRDRGYKQDATGAVPRTITYYECPGTVDDFVADLLTSKRTLHQAVRNADRETLVFGSIRRRRKIA